MRSVHVSKPKTLSAVWFHFCHATGQLSFLPFQIFLLFSCFFFLLPSYFCRSLVFSPFSSLVLPCPLEHQACLAQSLSTATSSWTGQTVLSWRPLFCCWVNYVVDNTMKSLPTSCSASLEKLSTFEKMKSSIGPNTKARFFQTCPGFFLFLVFSLHLK